MLLPAFAWWMILGAVCLLAVQRWIVRPIRNTRVSTCAFCTSGSGHNVTGHTTEQCRARQRAAERSQQAAEQHERERREWDLARKKRVEQQAVQAEALARRLPIVKIGELTVHTVRRGKQIVANGWIFDGRTERTETGATRIDRFGSTTDGADSGWPTALLHQIKHGGACTCDIARLAAHL